MLSNSSRIHLIAIGGSVMHNLALALKNKGHHVTGSDDDIFEPSRSRLFENGLLPDKMGWHPENINEDIDAIILGMHARSDNPELLKAQQLGLPIYSYPEFVKIQSEDKQRIVVAGSHGKTTITAIVLHVLKFLNKEFDYLIGASIKGFDVMVKLSDAPVIIIEGDEYYSSSIDPSPKFLRYEHHIALISGIAWDHKNVYPSFDDYVKEFDRFADQSPKAATLIYNEDDDIATMIGKKERTDVANIEYRTHPYEIIDGQTYLLTDEGKVKVSIFGRHNMQNIAAAKAILKRIGITSQQFYEAIKSFQGASNRLEIIYSSEDTIVFKDFAHAPSKVKASVNAVKEQYQKRVIACLELHTFSSLDREFLQQYYDTLGEADEGIIFINEKTIKSKGKEIFSRDDIWEAFGNRSLKVVFDRDELQKLLEDYNYNNTILLIMTSGNLGGINLQNFADKLAKD